MLNLFFSCLIPQYEYIINEFIFNEDVLSIISSFLKNKDKFSLILSNKDTYKSYDKIIKPEYHHLHFSIQNNLNSSVKKLITYDFDLNKALECACVYNNVVAINELLKCEKVDPSYGNNAALKSALSNKNLETLNVLLDNEKILSTVDQKYFIANSLFCQDILTLFLKKKYTNHDDLQSIFYDVLLNYNITKDTSSHIAKYVFYMLKHLDIDIFYKDTLFLEKFNNLILVNDVFSESYIKIIIDKSQFKEFIDDKLIISNKCKHLILVLVSKSKDNHLIEKVLSKLSNKNDLLSILNNHQIHDSNSIIISFLLHNPDIDIYDDVALNSKILTLIDYSHKIDNFDFIKLVMKKYNFKKHCNILSKLIDKYQYTKFGYEVINYLPDESFKNKKLLELACINLDIDVLKKMLCKLEINIYDLFNGFLKVLKKDFPANIKFIEILLSDNRMKKINKHVMESELGNRNIRKLYDNMYNEKNEELIEIVLKWTCSVIKFNEGDYVWKYDNVNDIFDNQIFKKACTYKHQNIIKIILENTKICKNELLKKVIEKNYLVVEEILFKDPEVSIQCKSSLWSKIYYYYFKDFYEKYL